MIPIAGYCKMNGQKRRPAAIKVTRDAVYAEHFPDGNYPPNTLLVISGLVRPEMKVEISAVVRLPD